MNSQQELLDAINTITQSKDRSCDTPATVLRVEGDTVWVHIDGGADETPVQKTINCEQGQTVQVRISNGNAFLVGNASAPPTDDKTANVAHFVAVEADEKATEAIETANAIVQTVSGKVDSGSSNIQVMSSTMYQNVNGVNIYNDTLAVGDSYAHIDGDSFDIKKATTAGTIDDANDTTVASFGQECTIGSRTGVVGNYSQVFGNDCVAKGDYSHAEGRYATAKGSYSHAEGYLTNANGEYSHAEGNWTTADGDYSHSEGEKTSADGDYSHSEGRETTASGNYSHAEGDETTASGTYSHAEGANTTATSFCSHAEGWNTDSNGSGSHSEGNGTTASANCSHAEGNESVASGENSHAQNLGTVADSYCQTTIGKYNLVESNNLYSLIIGNGTADNLRSDAIRVDWHGNVLSIGNFQDITGHNKTPTILESTTISAATTSYTFTDYSIEVDSVIDIYDTIFGFSPTNMTVSAGSCTVTFPAQASTHTIKLFVY